MGLESRPINASVNSIRYLLVLQKFPKVGVDFVPSAQLAQQFTAQELWKVRLRRQLHWNNNSNINNINATARLTFAHTFNGRFTGTRKVKPVWTLLKQETVSGSGISWAMCKSAPCSRQITTPEPHHSVFYRPDALPAAQPTASKH